MMMQKVFSGGSWWKATRVRAIGGYAARIANGARAMQIMMVKFLMHD